MATLRAPRAPRAPGPPRMLRWAAPALLCAALAGCSDGGPSATADRGPAADAATSRPSATGSAPAEGSAPAGTSAPAARTGGGGNRTVEGVWASSDGVLRLTLRRDGTFSEDYNGTENAYAGRYTLRGDALELSAATGESASGTVGADRIDLSGRALLPQR
ncbi:Atu4866 domain-containing protein [Streptomyces litmocidini]|uniref:Atu4866 domain-containing protein n=1 Tax=Streptomyces litmocidini TaxID=67318 RepID=UPI0033EE3363